MYVSKKHLSRRTVLRGLGVAVGLPLLDAMIPAATALAQTAAAPKLRAGFFYIPHGAIMWNTPHGPSMDHWTPSGSGVARRTSRPTAVIAATTSGPTVRLRYGRSCMFSIITPWKPAAW